MVVPDFDCEDPRDFAARITCAHNAVRETVEPPAWPPLSPLRWDPHLAALSEEHAEACRWQHADGRAKAYTARSGVRVNWVGENLALFIGNPPNPEDAVQLWAEEGEAYDLASNTCARESCGHYTQIVWAGTTHLGCARAQCPQVAGIEDDDRQKVLLVCQYRPGGNIIGRRPYKTR